MGGSESPLKDSTLSPELAAAAVADSSLLFADGTRSGIGGDGFVWLSAAIAALLGRAGIATGTIEGGEKRLGFALVD